MVPFEKSDNDFAVDRVGLPHVHVIRLTLMLIGEATDLALGEWGR